MSESITCLTEVMISARISNKIYHLASIALPPYRVNCERVRFCVNSYFAYTFRCRCCNKYLNRRRDFRGVRGVRVPPLFKVWVLYPTFGSGICQIYRCTMYCVHRNTGSSLLVATPRCSLLVRPWATIRFFYRVCGVTPTFWTKITPLTSTKLRVFKYSSKYCSLWQYLNTI